jgi:hypothetical protein
MALSPVPFYLRGSPNLPIPFDLRPTSSVTQQATEMASLIYGASYFLYPLIGRIYGADHLLHPLTNRMYGATHPRRAADWHEPDGPSCRHRATMPARPVKIASS